MFSWFFGRRRYLRIYISDLSIVEAQIRRETDRCYEIDYLYFHRYHSNNTDGEWRKAVVWILKDDPSIIDIDGQEEEGPSPRSSENIVQFKPAS